MTRKRYTLAQSYLLASLAVMVVATLIIAWWVGRQIETAVTNRTAAVTALYVNGYMSAYIQDQSETETLSEGALAIYAGLLSQTTLGEQVVSFKLWSPDGRVLYSPDADLIGRRYPVEGGLAQALGGEVITEVSLLTEEEQSYERQFGERLIETYAPVRAVGSDQIIAVTEFYQTPELLQADIRSAQIQSWLLVTAIMTAVYLLLARLVVPASNTITAQQARLRANVDQLRALLDENQTLTGRVKRAAIRTTTLNERFLRRIASDLHDGPAQDLALALLRMEHVATPNGGAATWEQAGGGPGSATAGAPSEDFATVRTAVSSALDELRAISTGLLLPEFATLNVTDTLRHAVRSYEYKSGASVKVTARDFPDDVPLPVKITLYRVVQEALANGFRHAGGIGQSLDVAIESDQLRLTIRDEGPGFNPDTAGGHGHLGIASMRERVEVLGGHFAIESAPGRGTAVHVTMPLVLDDADG